MGAPNGAPDNCRGSGAPFQLAITAPALYAVPMTNTPALHTDSNGTTWWAGRTTDAQLATAQVTPEGRRVPTPRCERHPAFDADYCPVCGTTTPIGDR